MSKPFQIIVKSIRPSTYEGSKNEVRLKPVVGQGFDSDTRVAFPTDVRYETAVSTLFKVWVVLVDHPTRPYPRAVRLEEIIIVSNDEAKAFIKALPRNAGRVALVRPSQNEIRGTALRLYSVVEQWLREVASRQRHCLGAAASFTLNWRRFAPPQSSGTRRRGMRWGDVA